MTFQYNDGGRREAGYKGRTRDCGKKARVYGFMVPSGTVLSDELLKLAVL